MTNNVFFHDISNEDYHARPEISRSQILNILGHKKPKATESMSFGTLMHKMLFENDSFDNYTVVNTKTTTKANCITEADKERATMLIEKLKNHRLKGGFSICNTLLHANSLKEKVIFGEIDGIACKIKPDCLVIDKARKKVLMYDYKTSSSRLLFGDEIEYDCVKYGYDIQAAFYMDVLRTNPVFKTEFEDFDISFYFIAQNTDNGLIRVFLLDLDSIEMARADISFALEEYKKSKELSLSITQDDIDNQILIISTAGVSEYRRKDARPRLFLNFN